MGDFSCVSNTTGVSFYYSSKLRFQSEEKESDTESYNRLRYSVLSGITYTTDSCIQADIGISTGGSPRSSQNNTMELGTTPSIYLGNASLSFGFKGTGYEYKIVGGRFQSPMYTTSPLYFDKDLFWSGILSQAKISLLDNLTFFNNEGYYPLRTAKGISPNPSLLIHQGRFSLNLLKNRLKFDWAGAILMFNGITGAEELPNRSSDATNATEEVTTTADDGTTTTAAYYLYNYNALSTSWNVQFSFDGKGKFGISTYGEFIRAVNVSSDNTGYLIGGTFWLFDNRFKADFSYRELQREATLDILPDDDCYGGDTDIECTKLALSSQIIKKDKFKISSGATLIWSDRLSPQDSNPSTIFQFDPLKFEGNF